MLLDPRDGEILAMATAPGFDPNDYRSYRADTRRNRAVADAHEPGSTFKIVTGALGIENALVSLDEAISTGDGTIRIGNTTISEHDGKRFGALTLAGVFEHSSNVGIIRVGLRLGPQRSVARARTRSASGARPEWTCPARTSESSGGRSAGPLFRTRRSRWARKCP